MKALIEKMFNQIPFIYKIDDLYYAFGAYACYECTLHDVQYRYTRFEEALATKDTDVIKHHFNRLKNCAELTKEQRGIEFHPNEIFKQYKFTDKKIQDLEKQIDRFIEIYVEYIHRK